MILKDIKSHKSKFLPKNYNFLQNKRLYMSEKVKKSRYIGRVEVFAAKIEISELLAAGLPYAWIYETLVKEKRLTVSYRQFCRCLALYCGVKVRPKKKTAKKESNDFNEHNIPRIDKSFGSTPDSKLF